jgi:phage portal protein BeeE
MGLATLLPARPASTRAPAVAGMAVAVRESRDLESAQMRTAGQTLEGIMLDFRARYGFTPWQASTYRGFLSVPGAWRASTMLSDLFAQMPFHSFRAGGDGGGEVATPRNAPILESPAASREDPLTVYASWAMDYLWDGNAVGVYTGRYPNGLPLAVLPVPVCDVGVRMAPAEGRLGAYTGRREYSIGGLIFDEADIFHVKGPCAPGADRGLGVLETQLGALTLSRDLENQADAISLHGVPTGVLKSQNPEADPADMTVAKAAWIESQRNRTVAALGPNIDFEPLSWNPEEMQLIEARKFSLTQLELMFGLPVGWLGGSTPSRTYSNVEQDAVNLIKFSALAGMVAKFESVMSNKWLPRGQTAKGNRDAVLRSDTMTRYGAHALALGKVAWKTVDEVRATENLAPLPDGAGATIPKPAAPASPAADEPTTDAPAGGADTSPEGGTA